MTEQRINLYQVNLESRKQLFKLEVATNNFDAVELAKAHICMYCGNDQPHVTHYSLIGSIDDEIEDPVVSCNVTDNDAHRPQLLTH
jgi:hypothetical protein